MIRHPGVNTAQPTGQPGQLSQADRARQAVEEERVRALRAHEAALEAQERDEVKYDPAYDFSFLQVCRLGKSTFNIIKLKLKLTQTLLCRPRLLPSRAGQLSLCAFALAGGLPVLPDHPATGQEARSYQLSAWR